MTDNATIPNHHAHYPGFSGVSGLVAACSMIRGRQDNARLAAELCAVGPADTVVDVGCGPGAAARYAGQLGATVVAVDPAPVMLRVARIVKQGLGSHGWTAEQAAAFADACVRHGFVDVRTGTHDGQPTVHTVLATAPVT